MSREAKVGVLTLSLLVLAFSGAVYYRYLQAVALQRPLIVLQEQKQAPRTAVAAPVQTARQPQPSREATFAISPPKEHSERSIPLAAEPFIATEPRPPAPSPAVAAVSYQQPVSPAPPVDRQPPARNDFVLTIENDSLWTISENAYGSGLYYRALYAHNQGALPAPDRLTAGCRVVTPPVATLRQFYPHLCPPSENESLSLASETGGQVRAVSPREGDTLPEVARRELGDPTRWPEIYRLNSHRIGDDIHHLPAGISLMIPVGSGS